MLTGADAHRQHGVPRIDDDLQIAVDTPAEALDSGFDEAVSVRRCDLPDCAFEDQDRDAQIRPPQPPRLLRTAGSSAA
jgi:hypothetical protein